MKEQFTCALSRTSPPEKSTGINKLWGEEYYYHGIKSIVPTATTTSTSS